MKNLELEKFGVEEMNTNELRSIDGGLACPGNEWLSEYNSIMSIGDDVTRSIALDIFFKAYAA